MKCAKSNNDDFIINVIKSLLDSNLIAQTNKKIYNAKLIKCGNNFIQLYLYDYIKIKKNSAWETHDYNHNIKINDYIFPKQLIHTESNLREIRLDNITRSKFSLERLIKSNNESFKTFITLTFKENIKEISKANKYFNIWRTRIKKEFKDFKYICVPEYQKRGAIHYHLLTNLELNSSIIYKQKNKKNMYDIKYWHKGFSSAFCITQKDINIIYYLSKYLTKDIDKRLYGHKRYFYSKNLNLPIVEFLNTNVEKENDYICKILYDKVLKYENKYTDKYNECTITFKEYNYI